MTRLRTQTLRLLPPLVAIFIASIIITGLWIIPSKASYPKESIEFGSIVGPVFFDGNTPQSKSYRWDFTINVVGEPEETLLAPRLPYKSKAMGGPSSGYGYMELDIKILINEEIAFRAVRRNTLEQGEPGNTTLSSNGAPLGPEQISQEAIREGSNKVSVIVDLHVGLHTKGSHDFIVSLGRPFLEIHKADSDHDGVVDANQFVSVHTGLVAIPAAVLMGSAGWWGSARLLRRW